MSVKYRFKTGETISPWLPSEALREAVQAKRLTPESRIQQAGRDDWVLASSIPGLFQAPPRAAAPDERGVPASDHPPVRHEIRPQGRAPETIHHLLHRSVPTTVHLVGPDSDGHDPLLTGTMIGVTTDCVMVEFGECASIVYLPIARIRFASIPASFPATGPSRKAEWIRLQLDSLPQLIPIEQTTQSSGGAHASAK